MPLTVKIQILTVLVNICTQWYVLKALKKFRALALRSRVLVVGSGEKEREEKEREEKEEEEEEKIAFRCIEAVPILSIDH